MSNLRKEYQRIVEAVMPAGWTADTIAYQIVLNAVGLSQKLADKPPIGLTDAEIAAVVNRTGCNSTTVARAVIAAHIAKQREPVTVKIRAAKCGDGVPYIVNETFQLCPTERWVSDVVEVTLYPGE